MIACFGRRSIGQNRMSSNNIRVCISKRLRGARKKVIPFGWEFTPDRKVIYLSKKSSRVRARDGQKMF